MNSCAKQRPFSKIILNNIGVFIIWQRHIHYRAIFWLEQYKQLGNTSKCCFIMRCHFSRSHNDSVFRFPEFILAYRIHKALKLAHVNGDNGDIYFQSMLFFSHFKTSLTTSSTTYICHTSPAIEIRGSRE